MRENIKTNTDFTIEVNKKFEQLLQTEEERTPDELWKAIKSTVLDAAKANIPKKKPI